VERTGSQPWLRRKIYAIFDRMRIARFDHRGTTLLGVVEDDTVRPLPAGTDLLAMLAAAPAERDRMAAAAADRVALADVRLRAPLDPPTIRDFSVFEQHIEGAIKTGDPSAGIPDIWYERPYCYFSNPHAITGPDEDIPMAPGTQAQDLELEVAAIIVKAGRNVRPEDAGAYIGGYTIFNDWSARDIGGVEVQTPFGQCKGKDFANTLGPWIVTPDELEPFRDGDRYDLDVRAYVNGEELGGDTLANMAWSFEEMLSYAARGAWLRPGDVIGSGTCGGGCMLELWGRNGSFSDPPPLKAGDVVTLEVEGIGTLTNRVVDSLELIELPRARPGNRRGRVPAAPYG
jgi:2-keto-4-pentenoate hydratase/2-oxohepta-3-ene-1,7-dioic acid hydratase in catechol pathway